MTQLNETRTKRTSTSPTRSGPSTSHHATDSPQTKKKHSIVPAQHSLSSSHQSKDSPVPKKKLSKRTVKEQNTLNRLGWRSKPSKVEPPPRKELYTVEFRLSEVITKKARVDLCYHLQDSMDSHVVVFEPLSKRVLNKCCELCERQRKQSRAESCPPMAVSTSSVSLPKLQRLRSRSVHTVMYNKPKEELHLPPIVKPYEL